ncbi:acetylcholine receptor subunit beta-type lev-1-like [Argopecten irradians]|uniref:acetylcholine receptor subunit beta-type lev-1-like n=1 Tax=Argopecten irradians TaxID=31199 RepID=UPI00371C85D6
MEHLRAACALALMLTFGCIRVMCTNSTYKTMLNVDLLNGYDPVVHPGKQYQSQVLNINVSFALRKIQIFNELTSEFSITGALSVYWDDERLSWDPTRYSNLIITHLKQKSIWTPPLLLSNGYDDIDLIGKGDMHIMITSSGMVSWLLPVKLTITCDADVRYYPFDKQSCLVILLPWGYNADLVQINAMASTLNTAQYEENPIWSLVSTFQASSVAPAAVGLLFSITFKRKPEFFVMNFLLPTMLMCFMNMFVFLLPAESGERVGFCITVLLSIAVFLSIVSSALPQTSSPQMAMFCYLLVVHVILSLLIMICTIVGLRFYFRSEEVEVPRRIARLAQFVNNIRKTNQNRTSVSPGSQSNITVKAKTDSDDVQLNEEKRDVTDTDVSWKEVSAALDKTCFVVFMATAMTCNISFIIVLMRS